MLLGGFDGSCLPACSVLITQRVAENDHLAVFRCLISECDVFQLNRFQCFRSPVTADNLRLIGQEFQIPSYVLGIVGHPDEVPRQIVHTPVQVPDDVDRRNETAELSRAAVEFVPEDNHGNKLRCKGDRVFENGQQILN